MFYSNNIFLIVFPCVYRFNLSPHSIGIARMLHKNYQTKKRTNCDRESDGDFNSEQNISDEEVEEMYTDVLYYNELLKCII